MQIGEKYLIDGYLGTIVVVVAEDSYSDLYPKAEWADVLKSGILVEDEQAGLIHYSNLDDHIVEKVEDR
ncbi:hypothetical protein [Sphingopyxis sp. KK2]|uniref:hypothetical protein n=1 Tax=Sphingopyxis sp. KK2 TaxID=1855727 RepID=UPI00097E6487|nr:hypothetical protein [Sphingopyxis sp. KK2]